MINESVVLFNEEEKRVAAAVSVLVIAAIAEAGMLEHGFIIAHGEIVGREA